VVGEIKDFKFRPESPEAIIGNSKMLVSLRSTGEIFRIFWPYIEYGQHLGHLWPGVRLSLQEGQSFTKWFHLANTWDSSQRYLENTNIVETSLFSRTHHLKAVQKDFVFPDRDVLARSCELTNEGEKSENITFLLYCSFEIEESPLYDGAYVDFSNNSLVFHRRNVYLAVAGHGYPLAGYHCGRRNTPSDPFQDASRGMLWGNRDNIRQSAGSMAWNLGELPAGSSKTFALYLAAGHSEEQVRELLDQAASRDINDWLDRTRRYWNGWLQTALGNLEGETVQPVYTRSLLAMKLMTNKETGASIAAPEFDPYYLACGGYGYCWPRDSFYVAAALDEAGYHDLAENFYLFASSVQDRNGNWRQRYFTDGSAAPAWGRQIDQPGSVLYGYWHHYNLTGNRDFLKSIWPSLQSGAEYLAGSIGDNGLPAAGYDLWEDENEQSAYSAAAVYGGLKAAAKIAAATGERKYAEKWRGASAAVREAILKHHWSPNRNRFIRGINRKVSRETYEYALSRGERTSASTDPSGLYPVYRVGKDERVDAALLGLVFPFGVMDPLDEKMLATVRAIEEKLWNRDVGGIHRYEGDGYRGGNPWLVTTLWLAIYYCAAGDCGRAETVYRWCLEQSNRHLLLPEQVDKSRGGPAWVVPLSWSHAMFVLAHLALHGKLSIIKQAER